MLHLESFTYLIVWVLCSIELLKDYWISVVSVVRSIIVQHSQVLRRVNNCFMHWTSRYVVLR